MKKRKWAGIAAAVLLSTGIGVNVSAATTTNLDESTLGGVAIEGLDRKEAQTAVSEEVSTWLSGKELLLKSKYETYPVPRNAFKFQIDASLNDYYDKTKRSWSTFFLKPKPQEVPLIVTINKKQLEMPETIDVDKTIDRALETASMLKENDPSIVYTTDPKNLLTTLASVSYKMPAGTNAAAMLQMTEELHEKMIPIGGTFSLLKEVKIPDELKDRTGELNLLGSAMYELGLDTDMQVAEHHSQPEVPKYGRPGVEAAIDQKQEKDLIFVNSNRRSYIIQANVYGDSLDMSLEALPSEETYTYELKNEKPLETRTVYRYTPSLPPGYEEVEEEGEDGTTVDVYRIHKAADGSMKDEKLIGRSAYLPKPKIIMTSSQEAKAEDNDGQNPDDNSGLAPGDDWYYDENNELVPRPDTSTGSDGSTSSGDSNNNSTTSPSPSPSTGSDSTNSGGNNSNKPGSSNATVPPKIPQAPAELKKVLLDSLNEECLKAEGTTDAAKQRCDRESEVVSEWLLKYLMENNFGSSAQDGQPPLTKSPELNGILKGMK